jgi:hypothetical protein
MSTIISHFLGMLQAASPCTSIVTDSPASCNYALCGGCSFTNPVFVHIFYHLESWFFTFLCLLYLLCWQITIGSLKTHLLKHKHPFCHIFFRKNFNHKEILYISEQSTTIANMMLTNCTGAVFQHGAGYCCLQEVLSPSQWEKYIVKKYEEKIISFFFGFSFTNNRMLFLQLLTCWISECT